jgi:exonuclease VII small subunit
MCLTKDTIAGAVVLLIGIIHTIAPGHRILAGQPEARGVQAKQPKAPDLDALVDLTRRQQAALDQFKKDVEDLESKIARLKKAVAELERGNVEIQRLGKQLEALGRKLQGKAPAEDGSKPDDQPPSRPGGTEGSVKAIDPKTGLVTIDLGANAGIRKGDMLEVFRLKPRPLYLGRLRIVEVSATEAIGRPVKPASIQVGDRVCTPFPVEGRAAGLATTDTWTLEIQ